MWCERSVRRAGVVTCLVLGIGAIALAANHAMAQTSATGPAPSTANVTAIAGISLIHGNAEPFAAAGYRIGERALKEFKLERGSFLLEVVHNTPEEVQWSCIADGVQAATGASEGKLNLKVNVTKPGDVFTSIRDRRDGKTLVFRLKPEFVAEYSNISRDKFDSAGAEVLALPDERIFSMASTQ
jgi:formylmethanofuran dehydrogenase subunit E